MVGKDLDEGVFIFGLEERVDGPGGELGEGIVGGGKDGERTLGLEGGYQSGSLDGGDEGCVDRLIDGVFDDVLVGVHGGAADGRVSGLGGGAERGGCEESGCRGSEKRFLDVHLDHPLRAGFRNPPLHEALNCNNGTRL